MRTSRSVCEEIKPHIYDILDLHLYPSIPIPGGTFPSAAFPTLRWFLEDELHCLRCKGGLRNILYHRINKFRVISHAPGFDQALKARNVGQLLLLSLEIEKYHPNLREKYLQAWSG
ncbi:hypothetical protein BDW75DRAFT_242474 [Aspergillus navahoensis]